MGEFQNIKRANAEIKRLRRDCAEAYQVLGACLLGEPISPSNKDIQRALDNLSAAANACTRPHDDLLPWPRQASVPVERKGEGNE
jgi:hypothetical protein